jgi:uncharacterized Fe-S cluster-containing MiaB family protein
MIADSGMDVGTYVVVKPPFLTEREAIEEASQTAEFAFDVNSGSVFLEPLAMQRYTLQDWLRQRAVFRQP